MQKTDEKAPVFSALESQGFDAKRLHEEANRIVPLSDRYRGVLLVADRLLASRDHIETIDAGLVAYAAPLFRWAEAITGIPDQHPIRSVPRYSNGNKTKGVDGRLVQRPPVRGDYGKYPVYSLFWYRYRNKDPEFDEPYLWLQAQVLAAVLKLASEGRPAYSRQRLDSVCRFLRQLQEKRADITFGHLGGYSQDGDALFHELQRLRESGAEDARLVSFSGDAEEQFSRRKTDIGYFAELLRQAWQYSDKQVVARRARLGRGGAGAGGGAGELVIRPDHQLWVEEGPAVSPEMGKRSKWPGGRLLPGAPRRTSDETDVAPWEDVEVDTLLVDVSDLVSDGPGELGELPPLESLWLAARSRARREVMANQRLVTDLGRVDIETLVAVFGVLEAVFAESRSAKQASNTKTSWNKASIAQEVVLIAAIILVTGAEPGQIVRMRWADGVTRSEFVEGEFFATRNPDGFWRPLLPLERKPVERADIALGKHLWIPDVFGLLRHVPSDGKRPFTHRMKSYEIAYRERLLLHFAGFGSRWNQPWGDLSRLLWSWLTYSDEAVQQAVSLLFGRDDPLSNTQRYYTQLTVQRGSDYYYRLMARLFRDLQRWGFVTRELFDHRAISPGSNFPVAPRTFTHCGDDRTPMLGDMRDLIEVCVDRCEKYARQPPRSPQLHNARLALTVAVVGITTGFRPVRTPIVDLTCISREGWLVLQDKDRWDQSHARIVWLPERVRVQVKQYLKHLEAIALSLPASYPLTLTRKAGKQRDEGMNLRLDLRKSFWWLPEADEWDPRELSGFALTHHIFQHRAWNVANANRHFLRSQLVERRCHAAIMKALMGHWYRGEENWGCCSSFDPLAFKAELDAHLNALLDDLAFDVVEFIK